MCMECLSEPPHCNHSFAKLKSFIDKTSQYWEQQYKYHNANLKIARNSGFVKAVEREICQESKKESMSRYLEAIETYQLVWSGILKPEELLKYPQV